MMTGHGTEAPGKAGLPDHIRQPALLATRS
jgi:hypothetical protein